MTQKNLVILFGGCSPEYPVSLESAGSVLEYIDRSRYQVLPDHQKGKISKAAAESFARQEYDKFNPHQKIKSDFDKAVEKMLKSADGVK